MILKMFCPTTMMTMTMTMLLLMLMMQFSGNLFFADGKDDVKRDHQSFVHLLVCIFDVCCRSDRHQITCDFSSKHTSIYFHLLQRILEDKYCQMIDRHQLFLNICSTLFADVQALWDNNYQTQPYLARQTPTHTPLLLISCQILQSHCIFVEQSIVFLQQFQKTEEHV